MRKNLKSNRKITGAAVMGTAILVSIATVAGAVKAYEYVDKAIDKAVDPYVYVQDYSSAVMEKPFTDEIVTGDIRSLIIADIEERRNSALKTEETEQAEESSVETILIKDSGKEEYLISGGNIDTDYHGSIVELPDDEMELLEKIVMGEAGTEGYIGAALVAQCIRDTIVYEGYDSVSSIIEDLQYDGRTDVEPNMEVKRAVNYIFNLGGSAVQHEIVYFYAPGLVKSDFHEKLEFVVEYGGHKFFR